MSERYQPDRTAAEGKVYLDQLFSKTMEGGPEALDALGELSGIAMGGHPEAQKLVAQIDTAVERGELSLPNPSELPKPPFRLKNKVKEAAFVLIHPRDAVKARLRQIMVAIEYEVPPPTSTFEEFPQLSLFEAVKAIRAARPSKRSGVLKKDWSKEDQERMERGELPKGYPEHPYV